MKNLEANGPRRLCIFSRGGNSVWFFLLRVSTKERWRQQVQGICRFWPCCLLPNDCERGNTNQTRSSILLLFSKCRRRRIVLLIAIPRKVVCASLLPLPPKTNDSRKKTKNKENCFTPLVAFCQWWKRVAWTSGKRPFFICPSTLFFFCF
jgi:hypothetical protein